MLVPMAPETRDRISLVIRRNAYGRLIRLTYDALVSEPEVDWAALLGGE